MLWVVAHGDHDGVVTVVGPPEIVPPDRCTVLQRMRASCHTMLRIPVSRAVCGRASGCHVALKVCRIIVDFVGIEAMHSLRVVLVVPASRR